LYETVDELRAEHVSLKSQVNKLEEDLASQYLRYRDQFDARKLLISDVNTRYHNELLVVPNDETHGANNGDPVMLRLALRSVVRQY